MSSLSTETHEWLFFTVISCHHHLLIACVKLIRAATHLWGLAFHLPHLTMHLSGRYFIYPHNSKYIREAFHLSRLTMHLSGRHFNFLQSVCLLELCKSRIHNLPAGSVEINRHLRISGARHHLNHCTFTEEPVPHPVTRLIVDAS